MKVTILICTRNRSGELVRTLEAIGRVERPEGYQIELLVVDNGSTDDTFKEARNADVLGLSLRVVVEPKKGKGNAYNRGLALAAGDAILFTDDDVRPPGNWIEGMCSPILRGEAEAVAGGVHMAPHLQRPWANRFHRAALFNTRDFDENPAGAELIGANMAIAKRVFDTIPGFDTELGPGALGFKDETLLWWQMLQTGFKVADRREVSVEHHFEPSRLTREAFMQRSWAHGQSDAYVVYHWFHARMRFPLIRAWARWYCLKAWRLLHRRSVNMVEGVDLRETALVHRWSFAQGMSTQQKRTRNYPKQGLIKLQAVTGPQ